MTRALRPDHAAWALVLLIAPIVAERAHAGPALPGADAHALTARLDADSSVAPATVGAPRDTTPPLDRYLGGLADSTDRHYGAITAPMDTAGYAGALAAGLLNPSAALGRPRRLSLEPSWQFNRTVGHLLGGGAFLGSQLHTGQIGGRLAYAFSAHDWFGSFEARRAWGRMRDATRWTLHAGVGRAVELIDSDRSPSLLTSIIAALSGRDNQSYLRRDGGRIGVERETSSLRLRAAYRDELESPLTTATTWNLFGNPLSLEPNLPARLGRLREMSGLATWRLPWAPVHVEGGVRSALPGLGSDFDYTRMRVAVASDLPLGRAATLVPQATYGRLEGDPSPQASFFLGGPESLRSIPSNSEAGQRKAFARLEVIGAPDLLEVAHIPHPATLNLSMGAQTAIGAVWGTDPSGGPPLPGEAWPARSAWQSEAGLSFIYRSGIPDPGTYLRVDWTRGLGSDSDRSRWSVAYARAFDQLRPKMR